MPTSSKNGFDCLSEMTETTFWKDLPALRPFDKAMPPSAPTLDEPILKSAIKGALDRICRAAGSKIRYGVYNLPQEMMCMMSQLPDQQKFSCVLLLDI